MVDDDVTTEFQYVCTSIMMYNIRHDDVSQARYTKSFILH